MLRKLIMGMLATAITPSGCVATAVSADEQWKRLRGYMMVNGTDGNTALAFRQQGDRRVPAGLFSRGGKRVGSGLGNQDALAFGDDGDSL